MKRNTLLIGLFLVAVTVSVIAADGPSPKPSEPAPTATNAPSQQIIAYYFHGTIRCHTCLEIEKQAKAVIEQQFRTELETKGLVFKPVNYQQPENAHFLQDYKLPCPSLVLVRQKDGKDEKWKLLGETWQRVTDPIKLQQYVETEVSKYLRGEPGGTNSNTNNVPSAAPDRR
jgi:hypothetical protein